MMISKFNYSEKKLIQKEEIQSGSNNIDDYNLFFSISTFIFIDG